MAAEPVAEVRPQLGPQEAFLATSADIAFYGGAAGGGKTWALLLEPLRHIDNPRFSTAIFRRESVHFTKPGGIWSEASELYTHLDATSNSVTHTFRFPSGADIQCAHMQHEKNRTDWKGAQIPLIEFDQVEEFTSAQFWYMLSRNRSLCGVRPYIRATLNPVPDDDPVGGWVHELIGWWIDPESGLPIPERSGVVRWFVRLGDALHWGDTREECIRTALEKAPNANPDDLLPKSFTFIPATLADNKLLIEKDPGYRANLLALHLVERERLLGGNWKIRPSAGKIFNRAWFDVVEATPRYGVRVRYWDKAGTPDGGAMTAGALISKTADGLYFIEDVVTGQWSAGEREKVIKQTAQADGRSTVIVIEQEPGSGGLESAQATIKNLSGWNVRADRATGDKYERAGPMSAQCEAGNVKLKRAPWNEGFLRRAHAFSPGGSELKDDVDAAVGAFNYIAKVGTTLAPTASLGSEALAGPSQWRIE